MSPLTTKGRKIMAAMVKKYGPDRAKQVFYASRNAGKISGVDRGFYSHMSVQKSKVNIYGGQNGVR